MINCTLQRRSADCIPLPASCPPTPFPGSRVPVQVHRPVPHPVLKSHLRDGGGAVQSEHPGALPVHPLRPEPGQPQLREPRVHAGQIGSNLSDAVAVLKALIVSLHVSVFIFSSVCPSLSLHSRLILVFLFFFHSICLFSHLFIVFVLLTDVPVLRPPLPLPLLSPSLACSWTVYRGVISCMPFCVSCSGTVLHLSKSQHPPVWFPHHSRS